MRTLDYAFLRSDAGPVALRNARRPPQGNMLADDPRERWPRLPIATAEVIPAHAIPANAGGRFSVLSPVGLLPVALIGIEVTALVPGAGDIVRRAATVRLAGNPGGASAVLSWLADTTAVARSPDMTVGALRATRLAR